MRFGEPELLEVLFRELIQHLHGVPIRAHKSVSILVELWTGLAQPSGQRRPHLLHLLEEIGRYTCIRPFGKACQITESRRHMIELMCVCVSLFL